MERKYELDTVNPKEKNTSNNSPNSEREARCPDLHKMPGTSLFAVSMLAGIHKYMVDAENPDLDEPGRGEGTVMARQTN